MICTLDGRLLAITDPLPGSRHDAHAFRAHGLNQLLDSSTLADKGYVGLGLTTPTKRRPGLGLLREQKTNNRVLNRLRSVVERVIAQVKTWRILHTGFRRPLGSYGRVFSSGAGVGVFGCGAPLMNKPLYMGEYSDDRWHKLFYIGSPFLTALIGLLLILIGLFQ